VDRSIVAERDGESTRYQMLDFVRQYAVSFSAGRRSVDGAGRCGTGGSSGSGRACGPGAAGGAAQGRCCWPSVELRDAVAHACRATRRCSWSPPRHLLAGARPTGGGDRRHRSGVGRHESGADRARALTLATAARLLWRGNFEEPNLRSRRRRSPSPRRSRRSLPRPGTLPVRLPDHALHPGTGDRCFGRPCLGRGGRRRHHVERLADLLALSYHFRDDRPAMVRRGAGHGRRRATATTTTFAGVCGAWRTAPWRPGSSRSSNASRARAHVA
jgi:hypothetical protein